MVKIRCRNCKTNLEIPDRYEFCRIKCYKCGELLGDGIVYVAKEPKRYMAIGLHKDGSVRVFHKVSCIDDEKEFVLVHSAMLEPSCVFDDLEQLKELRAKWLRKHPDINIVIKILELDNGN